jgi:hypothetical protein
VTYCVQYVMPDFKSLKIWFSFPDYMIVMIGIDDALKVTSMDQGVLIDRADRWSSQVLCTY